MTFSKQVVFLTTKLNQVYFRSINYNKVQKRCSLLAIDRNSAQSAIKLRNSSDMDYLENTCLKHQRGVCEFKPRLGVLLKTVDSVFKNVRSIGECQKLCKGMTQYECVSYDYAHTGTGVCRMSHHTFRTLSHVTEPYLHVNTSATYTLHNCYNLSVTCHHQSMLATVTSNKMFSGKVYTKSRYEAITNWCVWNGSDLLLPCRPHSCVSDIEKKYEFSLSIGYNDINCDVDINSDTGQL